MKPIDKNSIDELAALGGQPLFATPLNVGTPNLPDQKAFTEKVNAIYESCRLTNKGPFVLELEKRLAAYLGVKHCVCVSNGTLALEILIRVLGCSGQVICPSFTFVASAHAVKWMGLEPVFCDIDPRTHNIDPEKAAALINKKTSAILGVHVWGRPAPIGPLSTLARQNGLKLIFDAAHAFGVTSGGRKIGCFADAEVFSFHATKAFHTFEGGAVTTNDDELARKLQLAKNFGFKGYDRVVSLGTNAKMSEIHAAMGLCMLDIFPAIIEENKKRYRIYQKYFNNMPGVRLAQYDEQQENNFQYVVIEVDEALAGLNREELLRLLHAERINARRYFYPGCHRMEPYIRQASFDRDRLNETEALCDRVICLPTGTATAKEEAESIARFIDFVVKHAKAIRPRMSANGVPIK